jgi:protein phosphatase
VRIGLAIAAVVIVAGGALLLGRQVYFLGADDQGDVALYRGLPYELPLGVSLYSKQSSIPVQVGTLSEERQKAVTGHELRGKDDATDLASDIQQRPTAGLPPPPAPPPAPNKKKQAQSAPSPTAQKR